MQRKVSEEHMMYVTTIDVAGITAGEYRAVLDYMGVETNPSSASLGMTPSESTGAVANPGELVKVDTDLYEAVLSSRGARLMSFRLKKYRETDAATSPLYQMVRRGERLPTAAAASEVEPFFTEDFTSFSIVEAAASVRPDASSMICA